MIAALIVGGIGVALMQLTKQQTQTTVSSRISADIAQAKAEILTMLTSPANCNANFYGASAGNNVPLTTLYTCNTATTPYCLTSPSRKTKYAVISSGLWQPPSSTVFSISDRVRISAMERTIVSVTPQAPSIVALTTASIKVTFSSKPLQKNPDLTDKIVTETMTFSTAVLFNGSTVTGCPRSLNSTIVYGM